MKTSKIREQLSYRKYRTYNYVSELPSQEKMACGTCFRKS